MIPSETMPSEVSASPSPSPGVPIGIEELRKLVSDADPAALLVPPWLMRRVIKADRGMGRMILVVPHRKTYCISRDALLTITSREELGIVPTQALADQLVLLSCSPDRLADFARGESLLYFWRLLFHASIDRELIDKKGAVLAVREKLEAAELEEVERVLRSDNYLLPPIDDAGCLAEFVAVYLELRFFQPALLSCAFPGLEGNTSIDTVLAGLIDARVIHERTRPAGAPNPSTAVETDDEPPMPAEAADLSALAQSSQIDLAQADAARQRGNLVGSAILRMWAANLAEADKAEVVRLGARQDLDALVGRLQPLLSLSDECARAWRQRCPHCSCRPAREFGLTPPGCSTICKRSAAIVSGRRLPST